MWEWHLNISGENFLVGSGLENKRTLEKKTQTHNWVSRVLLPLSKKYIREPVSPNTSSSRWESHSSWLQMRQMIWNAMEEISPSHGLMEKTLIFIPFKYNFWYLIHKRKKFMPTLLGWTLVLKLGEKWNHLLPLVPTSQGVPTTVKNPQKGYSVNVGFPFVIIKQVSWHEGKLQKLPCEMPFSKHGALLQGL